MGRPRITLACKRNNILTRHLSSICGLSTASSKKDVTSLDYIFHSIKKSNKTTSHYSHQNSFNKNNNENIKAFLEDVKDYEKNKCLKNRHALGQINDYSNRQNSINSMKENEKNNNKKKPYFRRLYSHEYMEFEDEINKMHYVKKYKEDEITFTKSKILPEIQWQDLDNDVETSDDQKKSAIRKEVNWIGEAIKQMQSNDNFLKHNVTMYKLSRKYPNKE